MERTGTVKRIRIAAELEPALVRQVDEERRGKVSRAAIVRIALVDRYRNANGKRTRKNPSL